MSFNCKKIYVAGFHLEKETYKRYFDTIYAHLLSNLPQDWKKQKLNQNLNQVSQQQFCQKIKQDSKNVGICLSKIGMIQCAALNQTKGIKAAVVHTKYIAKMCREHNNANVMIISTDCIGENLGADLVLDYLRNDFDGEAKNKIRLGIIDQFEQKSFNQMVKWLRRNIYDIK